MKIHNNTTSAPQPLANPLNVFNHIQNEVVSNRIFKETTVSGTLLSHTQFQQDHFSGCAFFNSQMKEVEFIGCTFSRCNFWYVDFSSCNFIACVFVDCTWEVCITVNCNLLSSGIDRATSVFFLAGNTVMEGCYSVGPMKGPLLPGPNEEIPPIIGDGKPTQIT